MIIKLQKNTFYNPEDTSKKLVQFISEAKILSMGEQCKLFEKKFSFKQKREYSIYVNSGSSANLLLLQALLNLGRISKGDHVAVSSLTWATNIMPVIQLGLIPVLVDCELETLNISSNTFKEVLKRTPEIKVLFITNTLGFCSDITEISNICKTEKITLLEDNCEALGSETNKKLLGNFGLASTFSFFVGHHISTIEGGMVTTDDEQLANALIMARAHGWDRNLSKSEQKKLRVENNIDEFYSKYSFYDLGFNLRSSDINGFIGNIQIEYWDEIVSKRERNFKIFNEIFMNSKIMRSINVSHMNKVSSFAIPVIFDSRIDKEKFAKIFMSADVEIRPMIAGNMQKQPFFRKYIKTTFGLKNSDSIHENSFYFGNNADLEDSELDFLQELLQE